MFELIETRGDLFSCPDSNSLAHCVSEDMHMGKGIAVLFKNKFGGMDKLKQQGKKTGDVAVLQHKSRFIYYLVSKERYFHKPTYISLESCLRMMKHHCVEHNVTELAIPKIGCGLDRLEWTKVKDLLKAIFSDIDLKIVVYFL